ncbi:22185_t:CDS:1 [Dentiscutata erythropus]|uniref:22185_t:CDS:1 n=1 Tax=Dentiscutata erythropus TaxID=1348616 RepID=A0A9N9DBC9_9GLOM|nr:22185_t:CDS:1 [Dentiscutata erythropus]
MESLECEFKQKKILLSAENTTLNYKKMELEETLFKERNKLMQINDNLALAQKALLEKIFLLQEANAHLAEQISKVSSESKYNEVIGGVSRLEKITASLILKQPYYYPIPSFSRMRSLS